MLESEAIVVKVERGNTYIAAQTPGSCGADACTTQNTCSTAVLTRLFSQEAKPLLVNNPIAAKVGERVVVGLEEGAFLKSSLLAYVLPLFALIVGAMLGMYFAGTTANRDLYAGIGGLIGLVGSAVGLRTAMRHFLNCGAQPIILRRA